MRDALLAKDLQPQLDTFSLDDTTIEYAKICVALGKESAVKGVQELKEKIRIYEESIGPKALQTEHVPGESDIGIHGEAALRVIAALDTREFTTYDEINKLKIFPAAVKAMVLYLCEHPGATGTMLPSTQAEFGLRPFELVPYPSVDLGWRDKTLEYNVRLQYLNESERRRGYDPAKITIKIDNASGTLLPDPTTSAQEGRPLYEYEAVYKKLPHQDRQPGSFYAHLSSTGETVDWDTRWDHTELSSSRKDELSTTEQRSERVARILKYAAATLIRRYDEVNPDA
jgi:hypothetical protein